MKLYIAEKPNAAKDIAAALGILSVNKDYFYEGERNGEKTIVGFAAGHLVKAKEPDEIDEKYKKWNIEDLPITQDMQLKIIPDKKDLFFKLKKYIDKADTIVNAGDAGREGELIQRWILKMAGAENKKIYRLWASSLTQSAIQKANDNLMDTAEYDNLYAAGETRSIMDSFLGFNYSRALTITRTNGVLIAYGRCQSPILAAIVQRDREIADFKPEPYSYITANVDNGSGIFKATLVNEDGEKLSMSHEEAERIRNELSGNITIRSVENAQKSETPPRPYDILTLQQQMSKQHGYDADKTLALCQALYDTHHILSYPRTDSRYLTEDLKSELKNTLIKITFGPYRCFVEAAEAGSVPDKYFNDKKVADHHGLIPVIPDEDFNMVYNRLTEDERNVFDAVCQNFIGLFLPPHRYEQIKILLGADGYTFQSSGKKEIEQGFKALYGKVLDDEEDEKEESNNYSGGLSEGVFLEATFEIKDTETKPKKYYTTASLLSLMKKYGIGTGATRDSHIKSLLKKRGKNPESYVVKKGQNYIATDFGRKVSDLIPDKLKSLKFSGEIEDKLHKIEVGEMCPDELLKELKADLDVNIKAMKENGGEKLSAPGKTPGVEYNCPLCGKSLFKNKSGGYSCKGFFDKSCNFVLWPKFGGKTLTDSQMKQLLEKGRTGKIKGFKSKSGKEFDAVLIFKNGRVAYSFKK